uniref:RapZ C-terminal domain-containing protein n=1 Tax=Hemiselmis tepida TaxID=464990 RepID=A0A7S0YGR0_9CRYP|mmetsp:Transcript_10044/g.26002  ORF Transcript_10044/g.26002 Transcript_10044/m.26002 type:complete len:306 (+) Transcript_10044:439-1356(+)|eukprot:CAMPEP_0174916268 /NCGR_PEP_ID=MMETSP1355-20121228/1693_1 /TAXON_ID=464990 /ORGANISM="Hemiselmis tepida, Strain CCMP443" /LENGTH=305 /DNA_ID=CAMNT_0016161251 /DNA_START=437 /DNA_END=1354 /DNA_ORIENTATION=-
MLPSYMGHVSAAPQDVPTSSFSLPEASFMKYATAAPPGGPAEVVVSSFSFKTGPPCAANLVIDVRFLPDPRLLEQEHEGITGRHEVVREFLRANGTFQPFFSELTRNAGRVVHEMGSKGCPKVLFAVGCTAGKHRSVFVAEALAEWLKENSVGSSVRVCHRDLEPRGDVSYKGNGFPDKEAAARSADVNLFEMDMDEDEDDLSPVPTRPPKSASPPGEIWGPGPVYECTYCVETMSLNIRDRAMSMPCLHAAVDTVLCNGLSNLSKLRGRRSTSDRTEPMSAVFKMRKISAAGEAQAGAYHAASL